MRNTLITIGVAGAIFIGGVALDPKMEIVPWQYSQSVPQFDTPSGNLEVGQYSVTNTGQVFFNVDGAMKLYDDVSGEYTMPEILKLEEVQFTGERHEDVFAGGVKEVVTKQDYEALKTSEREPIKTRLRLAGISEAAIAQVGSASNESSYTNSITFALDCTAATDRGVLVFIANRTIGNVTGVTYNGTSLTKEAESLNNFVTGTNIWSLTAASAGSNNVVVSNSGFELHNVYATCLSGTDQTDVVEAITNVANGFSNSVTDSVTTLTDGAWAMSSVALQGAQALTSSQTELHDIDNPDANLGQLGVSYIEKATAGAQSMGWSWSSGDNYTMAIVAVKPSAGASVSTPQSTLQGGMQIKGGATIK